MSYTVTLSNGKVFTGLSINGSCYVSKQEVKASDFAGGLRLVRVSAVGEEAEGFAPREIVGAELGSVFKLEDGWYFWLNERSAEEREREQLRADVDYVALMTGVEI